ncbi:hypothetical protein JIG36_38305 [Actinoplanes sp. LDG1-06]|uniref:Novel STAND NTPase 1 domain-containing protein n=1 Tax=Paractinoplanes ovalisporus TaxID=2810368 RepID=A0ABS2AND2_9ACTN|nr:hypothetical protein [Actinoplanes ovalisporus]MBM2621372.1 hypothetical protein [Actinoplanes ovalisporus]
MAWFAWRWWRRRQSAITWTGDENPYPGLAAFDEDRVGVFFGRSQETWTVLRRLERSGIAPQQRFLALVGPSGSGKSSLLRAGVLPGLPRRWRVIGPMQPGPDVFDDLRAACGGAALRDHLSGASGRVVLVIDQLEDLFTQSRPADRGPFLDLLHETLRDRRELHVVVTMRPEFLAVAAGLRPGLFDQPIPVAVLDPRQMRDAIERPAAAAGVTFAPGLVDLMLAEATVGDALPLLGLLLQQLYQQRESGRISHARYDAAGRVGGAIAEHAGTVYQGLIVAYPRAVVDATLLSLVGIEGERRVRRTIVRASLDGEVAAIVTELRQARLLTDRDEGTAVVLAHDALFRQWQTLAELVEEHRQELAEVTLLERRATAWQKSGTTDDLLRGQALSRAETVIADVTATSALRDFLAAAGQLREYELGGRAAGIIERAQLRASRDSAVLEAAVATAMREITPTRAGELVVWSREARPTEHQIRTGHTTALSGVVWLTDGRVRTADHYGKICTWDGHGGLLDVARAGGRTGEICQLSPSGSYALRENAVWRVDDTAKLADLPGPPVGWIGDDRFVVATGGGGFAFFHMDDDMPRSIRRTVMPGIQIASWSPDGGLMAAVFDDQLEVHAAGSETGLFTRTRFQVSGVPEWSPDGLFIAAMRKQVDAMTCMIFDRDGVPRAEWPVATDAAMCWSRDGRALLATQEDPDARSVVVRSALGGDLHHLLRASAVPRAIYWSPDGRTLMTETANGVEAWTLPRDDPESTNKRVELMRTRALTSASLDDSGVVAALVGKGRPAVFSESEPPKLLSGQASGIRLSPRGDLVAVTEGARVRLWEVSTGNLHAQWEAPEAHGLAWSPDGRHVACELARPAGKSEAGQRVVSVFDASDGRLMWELPGFGLPDPGAWSSTGELLALSDSSGVALLDVTDGTARHRLTVPTACVALAWSAEGDRIALIADERIAVWRVGNAEPHLQRQLDSTLQAMTWSPDGDFVAAYGIGVTLFDTDYGGLVELPVQRRFLDCVWSDCLMAVTPDGTVYRWDVPPPGSTNWAGVGRVLTAEERRDFGLPPARGGAPASPADLRPDRGP